MKAPLTICLIALLALASCAGEGRYPVTGQKCGPDDPVKDMEGESCLPPV